MQVKTLLCFDYGEKRIGVAVGQTLTGTATPLGIVRVKGGKPDWPNVSKLIEEWQPQALVVGKPVCMDGARQLLTDLSEKFGRQLQGRYHLQVFFIDERLTTYEAMRRMQSDRDLDPVAAQIILESWLAEYAHGRYPDATITAAKEGQGSE